MNAPFRLDIPHYLHSVLDQIQGLDNEGGCHSGIKKFNLTLANIREIVFSMGFFEEAEQTLKKRITKYL